jgi:hypothetical protein
MARYGARICAAALFGLGTLATTSSAALIASDNAADPAYAAWDPGDNGGTGWGSGWTFRDGVGAGAVLTTTSSNRGWFVASSTGNDNVAGDTNLDGDINSPSNSKAWGVYSNTTDHVYAIRALSGVLNVGQKIMWDMDNGNIATGQVVGLRLLSNASDISTRVFEFRFVGGDAAYTIVGAPNVTTTTTFTREGLHCEYELTAASSYKLTVTKLVDNTTTVYTGTNANANSIAAIAFKNQLAGTGANADAYLNNIAVADTPEPASLGLLGGSALLLMRRRRAV